MKGPRSQGDQVGLILEGLDDGRVTVSLVDGRIGAQEIQVFLTLAIPNPGPFGLGNNYR